MSATQKAGVTLGLGYNRRLHPEMIKLRERIHSGDLGVILHCEANMTFPNALFLSNDAWRASKEETPCGGLTPMGVHAIDGMIEVDAENLDKKELPETLNISRGNVSFLSPLLSKSVLIAGTKVRTRRKA